MQAIILAAGMGKRLGIYTKDGTKCMVKVNGKSLIEYTIESLIANNIKRLVIVIGYKGDVLKSFINEKFDSKKLNGMKIEYIENTVYDKTNNIYSLYLASNELLKDDTLLFESDLIFKPEIVTKLIESKDKDLAVVSHFESWMDGTCTVIDEDNYIVNILDKASFNWDDIDRYYKTVNIYKFSKEFSKQYYLPFLESYQKAFGKNEYYEQVLKVLSYLSTNLLKALVVESDEWYEIDDPADLNIATDRFKTGSEKLESLQKRYGGYWRFPKLKDFCYLVNPYFPPQKLLDEMTSSFKTLISQYPSGAYQQSLLAAKIFGIMPEHVVVGNGAAELIASATKYLEGKIAVVYPTFNEYPERLEHTEILEIKTDKNFSYSAESILSQITNDVSALVLINPDNPSGNFLEKSEVQKLCKSLKEKNIRLIFDESFIDFAEIEKRYTLIDENILQEFPNLIIIKSISKSYGVPGLRLGILVNGDTNYIDKIKKTNSIWNINSFAEFFLQIYDKHKKYYHKACDLLAEERGRFIKELSKISWLKVFPSQANYCLCKINASFTAEDLTVALLEKYKLLIKDLSSKKCFEEGCYIRLAVRDKTDNDFLIKALNEVAPSIEKN